MNKDTWHQLEIRYWAAFISLALSLYTILVPETLNDDSYLYIRTAEIFLSDGITAAFSHYSWASYSILVGLLSLTGLSIISAAFWVNAFFYVVITYAFVSIAKEIDDRPLTQLAAAACVLFYPELNEYRYLIIRDVGFWAFVLLSVLQLINYCKHSSIPYAAGFTGFLIAATAFRIEAIVYLTLVPVLLLFIRPATVVKKSLAALVGISLGSLFFIMALLMVLGVDAISLAIRFIQSYLPFINSILQPDPLQSEILANALFGDYAANFSDDYLTLFLVAGLLALLIASMLNSLGWPLVIILVWGRVKRSFPKPSNALRVLIAFAVTNALIVFFFVFVTRFLPSRYAMVFALMLAICIPAIVITIFEKAGSSLRSKVGITLCLVLTYSVFDSYYSFGKTKQYIADSISAIEEYQLTQGQLITNEPAIAYYSGLVKDYDRIPRELDQSQIDAAMGGDYFAIEYNREMKELLDTNANQQVIELVLALPSPPESRILIYRKLP